MNQLPVPEIQEVSLTEIADLYWEQKSLRTLNCEFADSEADNIHDEMMNQTKIIFGENASMVFELIGEVENRR